jgi:hypothetical protein
MGDNWQEMIERNGNNRHMVVAFGHRKAAHRRKSIVP